MYGPFMVKVMHHTPEMSNQWKWPINNIEITSEKLLFQSQFTVANVLVSLDCLNLVRILNFPDIF